MLDKAGDEEGVTSKISEAVEKRIKTFLDRSM